MKTKLRFAAKLAVLGLVGTFVLVAPSRWTLTHFGPHATEQFQTIAWWLLSLTPLLAAILFNRPNEAVAPANVPAPHPPLDAITRQRLSHLRLALLFVLVLRIGMQTQAPLDRDQKDIGFAIHEARWTEVFNPFAPIPLFAASLNQTISTIASFLACQVLGASEKTLRIPPLFFSAALLALLLYAAETFLSPFTGILILAHLAFNQSVIWYLASSKGYVSMMLFNAIPFGLLWLKTSGRLKLRYFFRWFALSFFLALLTHTFAVLFCGLLLLGYLLWFGLNQNWKSERDRAFARNLGYVGLAFTPLMFAIAYRHYAYLRSINDLFCTTAANIPHALARALGLCHQFSLRTIIFGVAALVVFLSAKRYLFRRDFVSLFAVGTFIFFGISLTLLKTRVLNDRYFLAFLIPFLVWVGEHVSILDGRILRRVAIFFTLVGFVLIPALDGPQIFWLNASSHYNSSGFIHEVLRLTEETPQSCFTYSGDPYQIRWTKGIFIPYPLAAEKCTAHYWIHFGEGDHRDVYPDIPEVARNAKRLFSQNARVLYRIF